MLSNPAAQLADALEALLPFVRYSGDETGAAAEHRARNLLAAYRYQEMIREAEAKEKVAHG